MTLFESALEIISQRVFLHLFQHRCSWHQAKPGLMQPTKREGILAKCLNICMQKASFFTMAGIEKLTGMKITDGNSSNDHVESTDQEVPQKTSSCGN